MSRCFFLFKNEDYENYKNLIEKDDILLSVSPVDNIDTQKNKYICLNSFDEFSVDIEEFTIFYKKYFQFDKIVGLSRTIFMKLAINITQNYPS